MKRDIFSFLNKMEEKNVEPKKKKKAQPKKVEDEIIEETTTEEEPMENLHEEYVEKGLNYAAVFIKSIRKNFTNKEERRIVLESVVNAINLFLGDVQIPSRAPVQTQESTLSNTAQSLQQKMFSLPQAADSIGLVPKAPQQQVLEESVLKRDINIGLKVDANGNKETDLSKLTASDINEIKVLSGIK